MNKRICCQSCRNWSLTKPEIKVGWCAVFKKQTEWCAGTEIRTSNKVIYCREFKLNEKFNAQKGMAEKGIR